MQLVRHPAHQHLLGPILLVIIHLIAQNTLQLQLIQMIGRTWFTTNLEQVTDSSISHSTLLQCLWLYDQPKLHKRVRSLTYLLAKFQALH